MWDQLLKLNEMAVGVPLKGSDPIMPDIAFADTRSEFVGEAIQRGVTAAKATFKLDAKTKPDLIFVNLPNKGMPHDRICIEPRVKHPLALNPKPPQFWDSGRGHSGGIGGSQGHIPAGRQDQAGPHLRQPAQDG